jgi:DNA/RNA endonuclease YhcR with UshA esterase domain
MRTSTLRHAHIFVILLTVLTAFTTFAQNPAPADAPVKTDLAGIQTSMLESNVQVTGTVQSIVAGKLGGRAPTRVVLQDPTGRINLVFWAKTTEELQTITGLNPGDTVAATGKVGRFKESLQIELPDLANLTVIARATTPPAAPVEPDPNPAGNLTPLVVINQTMLGQTVTIVAKITQIRTPNIDTAPYVVTLTQDAATLPLVLWSENYAKVKDHLKDGNTIRVTGIVNTHKGVLQIKLRSANDLKSE